MLWSSHPEKKNPTCAELPVLYHLLEGNLHYYLGMQVFAGLKGGKKGQHSQLSITSASMRNWNKITVLSHTSGWQEVHA